jgi:NAD(P)-dependent dehydrogenase (short-subunit alcohol dehydrogenase family)
MVDEAQVAIVTGAGGNVGRAVVRRLLADGVRLVAIERKSTAIEADLTAAGAKASDHLLLSGVDLLDAEACASAVQRALARFGRIDGVAHTVGGFAMGAIDAAAPDLFMRMFQVNVLSALNIFAAALPALRRQGGGAFVAVAATAALRGDKGMAAYAAAKSGLLRLVESLAEEGKADGVRANAVLPSVIDTPQNRAAIPNARPETWARPEEVAEAIAFLLSGRASGVTGAALAVPGRT